MKPVDQEFVHRPEIGQHGDCQRAVLASLLDLPIAEVPNFAQDHAGDSDGFWFAVSKFCRDKGFVFAIFRGEFRFSDDVAYHGISGPSPRGCGLYHTVVGRNGQVFHDPHPSRAGLVGDPSEWTFHLLIRLSGIA